jgi:hypothetical protein
MRCKLPVHQVAVLLLLQLLPQQLLLLLLPPLLAAAHLLMHCHVHLQEAISRAVNSGGKTTTVATKKGVNYAQLANRGGVQPFMFDDTGAKRHLLQTQASYQRSDRMQMAGMAAQVRCEVCSI